MSQCSLCTAEKLTERIYEDNRVWVAFCVSHPNEVIVVLKRHTCEPTQEEVDYAYSIAERLFPEKKWRSPLNVLEHWHIHEEGGDK